MTKRLLLTLVLVLLSTSGCNLVYKQNIQQGNALEQEDLDKLRIGMSMNQVAFLLGSPAIQDPFHHNRWDYVSSFSRRGDEAVMRKITLYFENGSLSEMVGVESDEFIFEDEVQTDEEAPADAAQDAPVEVSTLAVPAAEEAPFEAVESPDVSPLADERTVPEPETISASTPIAEEAADSIVPGSPAPPTAEPADGWVIQLGAFDDEENARRVLDRLNQAGYPVVLDEQVSAVGSNRFLVRQYGVASRSAANELLQEIQSGLGINGFLVPPGE